MSQAPTVQKLEENQKKQKTNPVRRILGKSIQDCFFCFFWFIWFFSRFLLSQAGSFLSNKKEHILYMDRILRKKKHSFNKQYVTFIQNEADHKGRMLVGSKD